MKSRGLRDLYLPAKLAFHLKVILGGVIFSLLWGFFSGQKAIFNSDFLFRTSIIIILMEIGIWTGSRFFRTLPLTSGKGYTKKIMLRLLVFYLVMFAASYVILFLIILFTNIRHGNDLSNLLGNIISEVRGWLLGAIIGIMVGTLIFLFVQWQDALKNEQKLREEKLLFQYETIRNQVNPHFLFNSLNTLSSLMNGNQAAEDFIHRLSSIYRYVLENHNADTVALESEIEFVTGYFSLQKIRYEEKVELDIHPMELKKYRILPVSLQILMENALKHNASTREHPLRITIYQAEDFITVKNNLQKKLNIEDSTGTGLRNLGERLRLITNKEMQISETRDEFIVSIPLIPA